MSALGHKQTFCGYPQNVRFRGKNGHLNGKVRSAYNRNSEALRDSLIRISVPPVVRESKVQMGLYDS